MGIDPGKKGALALLDTETGGVTCHDMPDTTQGLHDLVAGLPIVTLAVLEKPFCGPAMGARSVAVMFENYGVLRGAIQWRDIPFQEERPSAWKAKMNLSKDKAASREKAAQIFPDDAEQFARVKDDGRAEAALLAWLASGRG